MSPLAGIASRVRPLPICLAPDSVQVKFPSLPVNPFLNKCSPWLGLEERFKPWTRPDKDLTGCSCLAFSCSFEQTSIQRSTLIKTLPAYPDPCHQLQRRRTKTPTSREMKLRLEREPPERQLKILKGVFEVRTCLIL